MGPKVVGINLFKPLILGLGKLLKSFLARLEEQCVKGPFFVQKLQILEKLEKWSIFILVSKLTFLTVKKFEMPLNFRASSGQKLSILWFYLGNFR